jgi:hypothetical protein
MSSSAKTPILGLNKWSGADKPQRMDFNNDNDKIESQLGNHVVNSNIHLTNKEKEWINSYCATGSYTGNGSISNFYELDFTPKVVFVAMVTSGAVSYTPNDSKVTATFAIATELYNSPGLEIVEEGFMIENPSNTSGFSCNLGLNKLGAQYLFVAFK